MPAVTGLSLFYAEFWSGDARPSEWPLPFDEHRMRSINYYVEGSRDNSDLSLLHSHDTHEVNIIISGSGSYRLPDREVLLSAGQVLFIPSDLPHHFYTQEKIQFAGMNLHPSIWQHMEKSVSPDPTLAALSIEGKLKHITLSSDPYYFTVLQELYSQAMIESSRMDQWYNANMRHIGRLAASHLHRMLSQQNHCPEMNSTAWHVLAVKSWIDRNFLTTITLQKLATMAHLSPTYFSRCFHQLVGVSPLHYVIQCRLRQSISLLSATQRPVSTIALDVGFDNVTHFNRTFKKAYGVSPSAYRQKMSNES